MIPQNLIDDGVITVTDGVVRLTAEAWRRSTDAGRYREHRIWHFVGFKNDRYWSAVKAFGRPDFVHRFWDRRAVDEVCPGDIVVFASGDEHQPVAQFAFDDSANF